MAAHTPELKLSNPPPTAARPGAGLKGYRVPGSLAEAETMWAYNQRIINESRSPQRRERSTRMLLNLKPHLDRLRALAAAAPPPRPAPTHPDYTVVWSGSHRVSPGDVLR